ncbi:uncharacterized protein BO96DRAFT_61680 [Aspergillus niger CBS 101883]|uniref:uncharacterized protein n=1 Tax=Aspergillus lacticoffeatus (strain CBS 101883) TaxID=1450533 RepID=UPI000D7F4B64|nr:uncharacterized protein BO96DRAFT_61680 [Aspergillus niger CBS 101883]PYH56048.1 hypothetical protein BO96DRAFT_61680 [Aspergillus niger CBS 101883]
MRRLADVPPFFQDNADRLEAPFMWAMPSTYEASCLRFQLQRTSFSVSLQRAVIRARRWYGRGSRHIQSVRKLLWRRRRDIFLVQRFCQVGQNDISLAIRSRRGDKCLDICRQASGAAKAIGFIFHFFILASHERRDGERYMQQYDSLHD